MNLFDASALVPDFPHKKGYLLAHHVQDQKDVWQLRFPNGELIFVPYFFDEKFCQDVMEQFLANTAQVDVQSMAKADLAKLEFTSIDWKHYQIKFFGKYIPEPRFSAWYGDKGKSYTYSGRHHEAQAWTKELLVIKHTLEKFITNLTIPTIHTTAKFNSVLMNWYRDGEDSMGWHSDDEKELGENPLIASVNFGATRRFLMRRKDTHQEKFELPLQNGSLLLMAGQMQHFWQHAVPKQKKIKSHRINLTFRNLL